MTRKRDDDGDDDDRPIKKQDRKKDKRDKKNQGDKTEPTAQELITKFNQGSGKRHSSIEDGPEVKMQGAAVSAFKKNHPPANIPQLKRKVAQCFHYWQPQGCTNKVCKWLHVTK